MKEPRQPNEKSWEFVDDLRQPLHQRVALERQQPRAGEADLRRGATLEIRFPDPQRLLATAHRDFRRFLKLGGVRRGLYRIEEATRNLFCAVPELGGLITISVGERPSHCVSGRIGPGYPPVNCPRCSRRRPEEVLADTLAAMRRGMNAVNPDAELISWPYSQLIIWGATLTKRAAASVPEGVILQHNFERGGRGKQLGKWREADDYWLSWIGPSRVFRNCAKAALRTGRRVSAKLQVGCSHEVATVPFVPVPGNLYRKYNRMHALGVSAAMQCWFFGNYPSVMTKAAGELSFAPFPKTEDAFLLQLARRNWGKHAPQVVEAWKFMRRGYADYPLNIVFSTYGPMHDGPVWPLHLAPADTPLCPTWRLDYETSGDRVGECINYAHSTQEVLVLCRRMAENWARGVAILERLLPDYADDPERVKDIGVATALGLQFQSGVHILRFYALRERMLRATGRGRLDDLAQMRELVEAELNIDKRLLELCRADSRLGFHSEAEGYKYFPAKIRWRMKRLQNLLATEFPRTERRIRRGAALWPAYTGDKIEGPAYRCKRLAKRPSLTAGPVGPGWDELPEAECTFRRFHYAGRYSGLKGGDARARRTIWKAGYDDRALYVGIRCGEPNMANIRDTSTDKLLVHPSNTDCVEVRIEPRRLWPYVGFFVSARGSRGLRKLGAAQDYRWTAATQPASGGWSAVFKIPFICLGDDVKPGRPMRINIVRIVPGATEYGETIHRFVPAHPLKPRNALGSENPLDLAWLVFE
ncbi:MAG: hypothetical protein JXR37_27375 [Kiritimatiellae bacterium]|nr:hypothetical protein [Kiritimatiellia bacterium]